MSHMEEFSITLIVIFLAIIFPMLYLALIKKYLIPPQIGENFSKLDVYRELRKIDGILDVKDVTVNSLTDGQYSAVKFSIDQNETSDGNMIFIPKNAIYEIKFPDLNINGVAI